MHSEDISKVTQALSVKVLEFQMDNYILDRIYHEIGDVKEGNLNKKFTEINNVMTKEIEDLLISLTQTE